MSFVKTMIAWHLKQKNGLKSGRRGILQRMPFAARFVACCLAIGLLLPSLQAQDAAFDPDTDPRIDRREHPNAPHTAQPPSPLDVGNPATQPKDDPIFLEFAAWIQKYRLAAADKKPILLTEGVQLAKMRRAALAELIVKNPQRALDWAISQANRAILPTEIGAQLETRVAGCTEYKVITNSRLANVSAGKSNTDKPRFG